MHIAVAATALALACCGVANAGCIPAAGAAAFGYDRRAPLRLAIGPPHTNAQTRESDLTFVSDGRTTGATLVRPRGAARVRAGVLFVHWLGDPATTNRTEFLADARALAPNGVTSLLVDAAWSKKNWFDVRTPAGDACDTVAQVVALRRALDVLMAQAQPDPKRVAYVGHDFGAMAGALLSAVDPRPRYVVLMTPALTYWEWFLLGAQPANTPAYVREMAAFDLPRWLPHARFAGSLLQFATHDTYVSNASASVVRNVVPNRDRTFIRYDTDHAMQLPAAVAARRAWLLKRLTN